MKKTILMLSALLCMVFAQSWAQNEVKVQVSASSNGVNIISGTVYDNYSFEVTLPGEFDIVNNISATVKLNDVLGITAEKSMSLSLGDTQMSGVDLRSKFTNSYNFGGSSVKVKVRKGTSIKDFTYAVGKSGNVITGTTDSQTAAAAWTILVESILNGGNTNGVYADIKEGTYIQVGDESLVFDKGIRLFDGDWNAEGYRAGLDKMIALAKENAHIEKLNISGKETFKGVVFLPKGSELGAGNHKVALKEDCKVVLDLSNAFEKVGNSVTRNISDLTTVYDTEGKKAVVLKAAEIFDKIVGMVDVAETVDVDVRLGLVPGDVNKDGVVNVSDVTALVSIILGNDKENPNLYDYDAADVNSNGEINVSDVTSLVGIILGNGSQAEPEVETGE